MTARTCFGWMVYCVAICGVVTACSAADVPAEPVASTEDELGLRLCGGHRQWTCADDQYCRGRVGHCPDDGAIGRCADRPEICTKEYAPVCGCDGVTYGNRCEAAAAGASVASQGECEPAPAFCGGIAGIPCPDGQTCIDDPSDDCDPNSGGADCGGICVDGPAFCGGIAGFPCPDGQQCIDNPDDDCDPNNGGADCGGICVASCGKATCGAGMVCCNPVMGICTKPGGVCIQ